MSTFNSDSDRHQQGPGLQMELGAKPKRRNGLLGAVFVVLLVGVFAVRWLSAAPTLTWSQPAVLEFLLPSSSQTLTVTFRSSENLSQVEVFVAPALSSVVSVTPNQLKKVTAYKDYKLDITILAPPSAGVAYDGTIQLKLTQGSSSTQSQPLPIKIVIHDQPVPPDPGEPGKATLQGIDSDADGLRDDIQRWIVLNYYHSTSTQLALRQHALAYQALLAAAGDRDASLATAPSLLRAIDCLHYLRPTDAGEIGILLKATVLNTELRSIEWINANKHLSGQRFPLPSESEERLQCDFDPTVI